MTKRLNIADRFAGTAVLAHSDVDGLCSAAILARGLQTRGHTVLVEITRKGESAWSEGVSDRLAALQPERLIVADLGIRPRPVLPHTPTVFIDHHRPLGVPPDSVVISGYGVEPTPTSGILALRYAGADTDLEWLTAMSAIADMADEAAFPEVVRGLQRFRRADLQRCVSLLNAPRRSATGDATKAFALLVRADGPQDLLRGAAGDYLRGVRAEVNAELAVARRVPPVFAGRFALLKVNSPCQVHPLVAQAWRGRLHNNIVIAANFGYLPGRVNFAVRTALDINLIGLLSEHAPESAGEEFAQGHDKATGGSLTLEAWSEFSRSLGFD